MALPSIANRLRFIFVATTLSSCQWSPPPLPVNPSKSEESVQILYDRPNDPQNERIGLLYAIQLSSLLGHFDLKAKITAVNDYQAGDLEKFKATFYLGSTYDQPLPQAFLRDSALTSRTLVWFKYNLWQWAWNGELDFESRTRLQFVGLESFDSEGDFFDTVLYKGQSLRKFSRRMNPKQNTEADPDVGRILLPRAPNSQIKVWAEIIKPKTEETIPYVVQSRNLWYFGDIPLSYVGAQDRYLVLCDLLHDILGMDHPEKHTALLRLEDVHAMVDTESFVDLVDSLENEDIPFSVAVIPHYRDPLGFQSDDQSPVDIPFSQATALQESLRYATQHGGSLVLHGFTHQLGDTRNPHSGVSGDDFEFWDSVNAQPVAGETRASISSRVNAGRTELNSEGFQPFAWETPHYEASPLAYSVFGSIFGNTYQRVVYYTNGLEIRPESPATKEYSGGLIFPYLIHRDFYGQRVIPENIGNVSYEYSPDGNWEELRLNAKAALVVRDGYASFFFHPYLVEPWNGTPNAKRDLLDLVKAIRNEGFTWERADQIF